MAFPPPRPPLQIPGLPPLPPMMPPPYAVPGMGMIPMTMGMMAGHYKSYQLIERVPLGGLISSQPIRELMTPVTMAVGPPPLPLPSPPKPLVKKPVLSQKKNIQDKTRGPPVTVFVGNITERATDSLIRQILQRCGTVINWKRVQGANGRLQAFGFCEYGDPESGLRSIRLLHDWEIGDKKLVVKVDAKTKEKLDEYKASRASAEKDAESWEEDTIVRSAIQYLLHEHGAELTRSGSGQDPKDKNKKLTRTQEALMKISQDGDKNNLDEMDLEEEKKSLIHREIDKFRDTYKRAEEEKEKERREKRDGRSNRSESSERRPESPPPPASTSSSSTATSNSSSESSKRSAEQRRGRETDTNRLDRDGSRTEQRERERERERERDRAERDRERERERERERTSDREKERSERSSRAEAEERTERPERRSRSRSPRERERERERETTEWKETNRDNRGRSWEREREEEEEAYERKKLERKLREKEAAYKERLRNWEIRERRKIKEYEKEKLKEGERKHEELKEARRLKEFLEDYDDDRDDPKYYKGSALARRLKEREKEAETDNRDRHKEREELEELRRKLAEEGHPDPAAEAKRLQQEEEWKFQTVPSPPVNKMEENRYNKGLSMQHLSMSVVDDNSRDGPVDGPAKMATSARSPSASPYLPASRTSKHDFNRGHKLSKRKDPSSSDQDDDEDDSRSGQERHLRKEQDSSREDPSELTGGTGTGSKWRDQERSGDDSTQNSLASGFSDVAAAVTPREETAKPMGFPGLKLGSSNTNTGSSPLGSGRSPNLSTSGNVNQHSGSRNKKKMTVEEAFNTQEDDGVEAKKRRRLIPLNDSSDGVVSNNDDSNSGAKGGSLQHLTTDEKRQHIKNLIDKIPTTKDELFAYSIDWTLVDSNLMERRIRPWINKKIIEYIGEEEPTLVEFICSKVMVGSSAKSILDDVFMVLDEEAEVFVVKMWRLLIYEIEAKKLGIMKV